MLASYPLIQMVPEAVMPGIVEQNVDTQAIRVSQNSDTFENM